VTWITYALTLFRLFTHSLTHSLTLSFAHSFSYSFIHVLIHSFTHSLTHSFTHSLTHSFIQRPLQVANASLLDEGTAGAEAMAMCFGLLRKKKKAFVISSRCHPQTIAVMQTRAEGFGIDLRVVEDVGGEDLDDVCGVMVQYPDTFGRVDDFKVRACLDCLY